MGKNRGKERPVTNICTAARWSKFTQSFDCSHLSLQFFLSSFLALQQHTFGPYGGCAFGFGLHGSKLAICLCHFFELMNKPSERAHQVYVPGQKARQAPPRENRSTMILGQTTTSMARLAASHEVNIGKDDDLNGYIQAAGAHDASNLRVSMASMSLENLQGPIPELSNNTPDWLEVYQAAAVGHGAGAPPMFNAFRQGSVAASSSGKRPRPSPYAQASRTFDARGTAQLSPALPAVAFNSVYGPDGVLQQAVKDDYAAALLSLTQHGYSPTPAKLPGAVGGGGQQAQQQLQSKFSVKGADTRGSGGGRQVVLPSQSQKLVSTGGGFMHAATSESVLAAIRRLNLARARQAAKNAAWREANKPVVEKEKKVAIEKPPTVRKSTQFEDGSKYRGDWSTRGLGAHGTGVLKFPSGDEYKGSFKRHLFDGWGTYCYANGDKYEGPWKHGEKHGAKGTFTRAADSTELVVGWRHDKAHGHGICKYGNGARFEGEYVNDLKEGTGVYVAANGDEYHGTFVRDKIQGHGRFVDMKNGATYSGTFANSKRQGRTDPRGNFTLHHGLFGDFSFKGSETFGGDPDATAGLPLDEAPSLSGSDIEIEDEEPGPSTSPGTKQSP